MRQIVRTALGVWLRREARGQQALLVIGLLGLGAIAACSPNAAAIQAAHDSGAYAGRQDGLHAGEANGYAEAFTAANESSYKATLRSLYAHDKFNRRPLYTSLVITIAFLLGFGAQYFVLYRLRVSGVPDIDRIVLPRQLTEVNLVQVAKEGSRESGSVPPSCWMLFLLIPLLSILGCEDELKVEWKRAYKANYDSAYQEGLQAGELRGTAEGKGAGTTAAEKAAESGEAWQLYTGLALWSLGIGVFLGLSAQYIILFECRRTGRLRQLPTLVFVPAMSQSLAYSVFDNYRRLKVETDSALMKLGSDRELKEARMKAVVDNYLQKAKALGSIEQFGHSRLMELAEMELSRIVSASEEKARGLEKGKTTDTLQ